MNDISSSLDNSWVVFAGDPQAISHSHILKLGPTRSNAYMSITNSVSLTTQTRQHDWQHMNDVNRIP